MKVSAILENTLNAKTDGLTAQLRPLIRKIEANMEKSIDLECTKHLRMIRSLLLHVVEHPADIAHPQEIVSAVNTLKKELASPTIHRNHTLNDVYHILKQSFDERSEVHQ